MGTLALRTSAKAIDLPALRERGRQFHRNTTCTLHEGSYQNAPNSDSSKFPYRQAKPACISVMFGFSITNSFLISTKDVTDGTV